MYKVALVSDSHNRHNELIIPKCDLLLHAGDCTHKGTPKELENFVDWLNNLNQVKTKVFIGGNHDRVLQSDFNFRELLDDSVHYLENTSLEWEGYKIFGSPWQPTYKNMAFNLPDSSEALYDKWLEMPNDVDIIVSHTPPHGVLDILKDNHTHVGCEVLAKRLKKVKPVVVLFGHVHESRGQVAKEATIYCNASVVPSNPCADLNKPFILEICPKSKYLTEPN